MGDEYTLAPGATVWDEAPVKGVDFSSIEVYGAYPPTTNDLLVRISKLENQVEQLVEIIERLTENA